MLSKLFTAILLCSTLYAAAQQTDSKKKNEKAKETPVKIDYHQVGTPMPPVKLITVDTLAKVYEGKELKKTSKKYKKELGYTPVTKVFTDKDLDNGKPLYMMMFNPTCGHCEEMTDKLAKRLKEFKGSTIVLIANPIMKTYFPDFIKNHKVRDYAPDMLIGTDSAGFNDNTYLYGAFPQISVYSSDRKLLKMYNGEISIDTLLQYVK